MRQSNRTLAYARRFVLARAPKDSKAYFTDTKWNGMEWNEMKWNEMEWNGMEWNGME